jgi:positive regulator of sigma E activity
MSYWLQSLQENAFDVFIVTIIIFSIISYHYLDRWDRKKDKQDIIDEIKGVK